MRRTYLGIQIVPDPDRKGSTVEVPDCCRPAVTEKQCERANAIQGRPPVHNGLSETVNLKGVVKCGVCGRTMYVLAYG